MKRKDHDEGVYIVYLAIIAIWVMVGSLAQCESARNLEGIKHELFLLRNK